MTRMFFTVSIYYFLIRNKHYFLTQKTNLKNKTKPFRLRSGIPVSLSAWTGMVGGEHESGLRGLRTSSNEKASEGLHEAVRVQRKVAGAAKTRAGRWAPSQPSHNPPRDLGAMLLNHSEPQVSP